MAQVEQTEPQSRAQAIVASTLSHIPIDGLESRNLRLSGHRTSIRLEPPMWQALSDAAAAEGLTIDALCTAIDQTKPHSSGTASAVRVFLMQYFREKCRTR